MGWWVRSRRCGGAHPAAARGTRSRGLPRHETGRRALERRPAASYQARNNRAKGMGSLWVQAAIRNMPARVKALINPALVTWARETAGFTRTQAAGRLDIEEARLAAWEDPASDETPSVPQ